MCLLIFCGGHCSDDDDDFFPAVPDFAEVYNFIGSVFDPEKRGHVEKLKEMDPVNFETVSQSFANFLGLVMPKLLHYLLITFILSCRFCY